MMLIVISLAVSLVAFIMYALDRRSKEQPISWPDAMKLTVFSGLITSGVVFATTSDLPNLAESIKVVAENVQSSADMFVGTPQF